MNSAALKDSRNLWPYALVAWFALFAAALAAWTIFATRQNLDLVRADYYEEELRFQRHFDRLKRTEAIRSELGLDHDRAGRAVVLRLPPALLTLNPKGEVRFYRPSDASLDFSVPLHLDSSGRQRLGVESMREGLWKIRAEWSAAGQDYFLEQVVVLDRAPRSGSVVAPARTH